MRNILGSIALHAVVLGLGLLLLRQPKPLGSPESSKSLVIEVAQGRLDSEGKGSGTAPSGRTKRGSKQRRHGALPRLRNLGLFAKDGIFSTGSAPRGDSLGHGDGEESPYGFGEQLPSKQSPILAYLFHRLDRVVSFPPDLRSAGMEGEVIATLRFSEKGEWLADPSDFKTTSLGGRYLRVHLLRRLRKTLSEPIPANLMKSDPQAFTIKARFTFAITAPEKVIGAQIGPQYAPSANPNRFSQKDTNGGQSIEKQLNSEHQGAYGRSFRFYRVHLQSPLQWKLGPLAGYGIMPVVGINPGWFVDTIEDLIHDRKRDPLQFYRDDPEW